MAYFSNSCEGYVLDRQCRECKINSLFCPICHVQEKYNYKQLEAGQLELRECLNFLIGKDFKCQISELLKGDEKNNENTTGMD
jgi:hypothetical protein